MYRLLVGLMILSAVFELGITFADFKDQRAVDAANRKVLKIEWKAISVFPNEARRFQ